MQILSFIHKRFSAWKKNDMYLILLRIDSKSEFLQKDQFSLKKIDSKESDITYSFEMFIVYVLVSVVTSFDFFTSKFWLLHSVLV